MKKLVATLSLAALATGAFAQGFVTVNNGGGTTAMNTNATAVGGTSGNTSKTASAYYYDVLVNASTVTTINSSLQGLVAAGWSDTGVVGNNNTGLGAGGKITPGNTTAANWVGNEEMSAVVIGWSAGLGTTWAQVQANLSKLTFNANQWSSTDITLGGNFLGATTVAQAISGTTAATAAALFGSGPTAQVPNPITTQTTLWVVTVPEPGTMALAGLGVASLLIFRRRK